MTSFFKRFGVIFLLLLVGGGIFFALIAKEGIGTIVETLRQFGIKPFLLFIAISLVNFGLYTYRWWFTVNDGVSRVSRVGFWKMYGHRMSGYAMGYVLPMQPVGGEPVRVALLTKEGVNAKKATSSVVIDLAFEMTAFVLFVTAGFVLAVLQGIRLGSTGITGVLVLMLVGGFLGAFYLATVRGTGFFQSIFRLFNLDKSRSRRMKGLYQWIGGMEDQMTLFLKRRKIVPLWLLVLSLGMISFRAVEQWFIAHYLGFDMNIQQAFLTATIPGVALLLPVPAGLGFLEASNTAIFGLLGIPVNALAVVLIVRLRDLVFIGLGILNAWGQMIQVVKEKFGGAK